MLTIIGCGNANRRDDAVGVTVARRVRERLERHPVPGVQALDCGTAGMEVMFAAKGSDAVILVDAAVTGSEPGAVFEVPSEELERVREPSLNLHDLRWDDALGMGRKIYGDDFPSKVSVFLIEAADTGFGLELSPPVEEAAETVYRTVLDRIAAHAVDRHDTRATWDLQVDRGWVQIPGDVYASLFDGREGVVPFALEDELCFMPVEQITGGLLVKIRNARGDRAIDAGEFLRNQGWDDWGTYPCVARWENSLGALALRRVESNA